MHVRELLRLGANIEVDGLTAVTQGVDSLSGAAVMATEEVMGATDVQVARLFQRRIALDALFGGLVGFGAAALALVLIGQRIGALGSDLIGSANLPATSWLALALLPALGVGLAMLVARATILRALGSML